VEGKRKREGKGGGKEREGKWEGEKENGGGKGKGKGEVNRRKWSPHISEAGCAPIQEMLAISAERLYSGSVD